MDFIIIVFFISFPLLIIFRSYRNANKYCEIIIGEKSVLLPPVLHRILFFSRPRRIAKSGLIFQLVITLPFIVISLPTYGMLMLWMIGKVAIPCYITIRAITCIFLFPIAYLLLSYAAFNFTRYFK
jgi:hypothetical protein